MSPTSWECEARAVVRVEEVRIRVRVRTILHLIEVLGAREQDLSLPAGTSLGELLALVARRARGRDASALFADAGGTVRPHVRILVNGRQPAFLQGMETELHDGDDVLLLPPAAGG